MERIKELKDYLSKKGIRGKKKITSLYTNLSLYIPNIIYTELMKKKSGLMDGLLNDCAMLIADITGFTALSEELSKVGKEGAEEITEIVNSYFSHLLDVIFMYGGDLYHFSGDALSVLYYPSKKKRDDKELRALLSAWEMKKILEEYSTVKTSKGTFPLKVHMTLHTGKVTLLSTGMKDVGLYYFACGKATNEIASLEEKGKEGEIILSERFHSTVRGKVKTEKKGKDRHIVKGVKAEIPVRKIKKKTVRDVQIGNLLEVMERLKPFINPVLFNKFVESPSGLDVWGEHRKVTILFLNFLGFDFDEDEESIMNFHRYFSELEGIVERYDGTIDKLDFSSRGYNAMVLFGVPFAHEDDEERAVRCAFDILSSVWSQTLTIKMRIGINAGFVFAGNVGSTERREYTVMGDEVNLAARLLSKAKEGDIIVSDSVYKKIKKSFKLEKLKLVQVKGKEKSVKIYRVKGIGERGILIKELKGGESDVLIGREEQVKKLKSLIRIAKKGKGSVVTVLGEAGVGKSRLTREFIEEWDKKGYEFAMGSCQFYGKPISYHPWKEPIATFLGLEKIVKEKEKKKAIKDFMKNVNPALSEWSPIIGELLDLDIEETKITSSIDAKLRKQRLFDIILDLLSYSKRTKKRRKKEPLLLILEDFHWADTASSDLLNYIVRNIKDLPILIMVVTRPVKERREYTKYPHHQEIPLKELKGKEIGSLIGALLDVKKPNDSLVSFIRKETQGNPFYVEELIRSLIERSILKKVKGEWILPKDTSSLTVPDTIQGVIMSRIDRLTAEVKSVLLTASVIGREFDFSTIKGIYEKERKDLKKYLTSLQNLDLLLYQKTEKEERYIFKHILTQEVAYDSLSFKRKRDIHLKVADFIEHRYRRSIEEVLGFLTHHYYKGQEWEKAFYYSIEAGDKAKKAYANIEALSYYDTALEILEKMHKSGVLEKIWKRIKSEL
jgi:class 3 adenylate cyclase